MPALIQNHQDKVIVTRLKTAYSIINNAYYMAQMKYDTANTWSYTDDPSNVWFTRLAENLNLEIDCAGGSGRRFCADTNYYKGKGPVEYGYYLNTNPANKDGVFGGLRGGLLNNGMLIGLNSFREENNKKWWGRYGYIYVDINGFKGPNLLGKDTFRFEVADYDTMWETANSPKLFPSGIEENAPKDSSNGRSNTRDCLTNSYACAGWVIKYENVDYLHCRQKLIDKGTASCKD